MEAHGTEEAVYSVKKILDFLHYKYKVFNAHVFFKTFCIISQRINPQHLMTYANLDNLSLLLRKISKL